MADIPMLTTCTNNCTSKATATDISLFTIIVIGNMCIKRIYISSSIHFNAVDKWVSG